MQNRMRQLQEFLEQEMPEHKVLSELEHLQEDMENQEQRIAVLGEFKRGKSSIINALLQEELMPVDVLPTTAVLHKIKHGQSDLATVYTDDEEIESIASHQQSLMNYTYESQYQHVNFIELYQPLDHLGDNVELIDTPGIGDLNDHRFEVTYEHIPRADLIIFVFDMTTPIRKTELTYLRDTVLPLAMGEIMYVANFSDRVDEEEVDEVIEYMEKKLKKITGHKEKVYAVSSLFAMEDDEDEEWQAFEHAVKEKITTGKSAEQKERIWQRRFYHSFSKVDHEMELIRELQHAEQEELQALIEKLEQMEADQARHRQQLDVYTQDRQQEIMQLTTSSLAHFMEELENKVIDEVDSFEGENIKVFFEKQLPKTMEHEVRAWINMNAPKVDHLMAKVRYEIGKGLAQLFRNEFDQTRLQSSEPFMSIDQWQSSFSTTHKKTNSSLKAGAVGGGAAAIVGAFGASMVTLPLLLVGMPFLKDYFKDHKLKKFKKEAIPLIREETERISHQLHEQFAIYIRQQLEDFKHQAMTAYQETLLERKTMIEQDLKHRHAQTDRRETNLQAWDLLKTSIEVREHETVSTHS
ncbi:dynamin family protein [Gracilibacillus halophilus YIM-C55.5]|uniref:Dynamin family protein n=1 Tax=Gracilibacillus halophilus YIM-C55.5 TaxID=1308866 RepID=N4W6Z3_9BACI|nr:dynamin family protein [Gracilibacillus halophilus]ENH95988.1 dynamin family protein [Gracilibacillus halophilus YIM-C55.5]